MAIDLPHSYQPNSNCLQGRVILVTGAAKGIGACASQYFSQHGATVILLDQDVKKLKAIYDVIERASYPQPAIYPLDLQGATEADYVKLADCLSQEFDGLDGLLHNAARRDPLTPLWKVDLEDWFEILQVNLNAPFMLTCACLDLLNRAPSASVVFTTDHQARRHHAYWGGYGVSKHGIDGLMLGLADELENCSPVRVNAIDPGPVKTDMRVKTYPGLDPEQMMPPKAIMPHYLYLMSDDSQSVNGEVLLAQKIKPAF